MLQISNQRPYKKDEKCILQDLENLCRCIIKQEKYARFHLLNSYTKDVFRFLTQAEYDLQTMRQVNLSTGIKKLALYRLGIALGITKGRSDVRKKAKGQRDQHLKCVDRLALHIQPAHIHKYERGQHQITCSGNLQGKPCEDEDTIRAKLIQQVIRNT
jgi:protein-arginine kinase